MIGTIAKRIIGAHLFGDLHLQAKIETIAWRVVIAGTVAAYHESPKFKAGLDQIIAAVTGG